MAMKSNERAMFKKSICSSRSYGSIYEVGKPYESQQSSIDVSLFSTVAQNLRFRRDLFGYRRFMAKFCLVLGLFGLSLAILDNQISLNYNQPNGPKKNYIVSFVIKFCITLTTVMLMFLIVVYHNMDLRIEMQRYNISDWKLALNIRRIIKFITEIVICSCQPLPVDYHVVNSLVYSEKQYTYDGIMTILMCLRFYLLARVLILRSTLHQDISAQSFSAINQTSVNTKFIFKSWMTLYSIYILISLIIFIFIWGSWATTVCEVTFTFSDSMWLTAVTFLSIGYGDIIPTTTCGRAVAVLTGALGAGCTALVVAIVSSKLELTQTEKYLHNFVEDSKLNQQLKHVSANIVKYYWRLYRLRTQKQISDRGKSLIYNKRQLLYNIRQVRAIRTERRHLLDSSISILEVSRAQINARSSLDEISRDLYHIETNLQSLRDKLN